MNTIASNNRSGPPSAMRLPNGAFEIRALLILLTMIFSSPLALCQSQSSSQPSPSQPSPPAQPQQKDDSKADAAKKTEKEKPKAKKVYTEEDLSNMRGGVSVVGDSTVAAAPNSNGHGSPGVKGPAGEVGAGVVPMSGQDEKYWRGKAKELLDEITAIDHETAKTKDEIKKYGAEGFDAASRLGVIYVDNRVSKVQQLEKRKSELEKKLDQLQEDGRKAGAAPEWFR